MLLQLSNLLLQSVNVIAMRVFDVECGKITMYYEAFVTFKNLLYRSCSVEIVTSVVIDLYQLN